MKFDSTINISNILTFGLCVIGAVKFYGAWIKYTTQTDARIKNLETWMVTHIQWSDNHAKDMAISMKELGVIVYKLATNVEVMTEKIKSVEKS